MQTLTQIRELLASRGLTPKRSLGQNFLADQNLIRKLVDAATPAPGDTVLEIGPGTGTLTEELLARGCHVVACELDDRLAELLTERLTGRERFTLIHGDCLDGKHALNPAIIQALAGGSFALIANLPYGAATPLLSTLLTDYPQCRTFAVTIQRELADRLLAKPSTPDFGPLAVIAQSLCTVERIANAPPECFWPRPDVVSSLVLMRRRDDPLTRDAAGLSAACRVLFAHRRKQLGSLLPKSTDWKLVEATTGCEGITPRHRAEQLSIPQIVSLAQFARP